jgi:hypothetical protein
VLAARTCVGLGVHARSVVGRMIDSESAEIVTLRLSPKVEAIVSWVRPLPGPVAVTYEHLAPWRAGVILGKLVGAVRSTSAGLSAGEPVYEQDVRVLSAVNCRFERDLQAP